MEEDGLDPVAEINKHNELKNLVNLDGQSGGV